MKRKQKEKKEKNSLNGKSIARGTEKKNALNGKSIVRGTETNGVR